MLAIGTWKVIWGCPFKKGKIVSRKGKSAPSPTAPTIYLSSTCSASQIGHVYHLFRLPEELEQGIHQELHSAEVEKAVLKVVASKDAALNYLRKQSTGANKSNVGPTRVGNIEALREPKSWRITAGLYLHAFENEQPVFPYFTDLS